MKTGRPAVGFTRHEAISLLCATMILLGGCGATSVGRSATLTLDPGADIQAAVDSAEPGTTFLLNPGLYRLQSVKPRDGDSFVGAVGGKVILSGAKTLSFQKQESYWVADGQDRKSGQINGIVAKGHEGAKYPEDLFFDGHPLLRVTTIDSLGPGRWYFDLNGGWCS